MRALMLRGALKCFIHFCLIVVRIMPSPDQRTFDDHVLTRYLLGSLPAEQAERLDELSIADEEFVGGWLA